MSEETVPKTEDEDGVELAAEEAVEADEDEYEPPVTGEEFRETIGEAAQYVKDAWLQPARRWIRGGFDAVEDFTRDLSGKKRKK